MDSKFHTLNEGIPIGKGQIGMDTLNNRDGVHFWVRPSSRSKRSVSVYLSRKDAMNLIEEIKHRLF
jgi:hypothetical protein